MKIKQACCLIVLLSSLVVTGCWDRTEVNDLALVMAAALDLTEDGKLRLTMQVVIPSGVGIGPSGERGGGGQQKGYFIETAVGRNILDARQKIQEKLSRRLFIAHRRVVFIGERLAKHGIKDVLDELGRAPESRLRSYLLMAAGREARELLEVDYPFERVPAEAVRELERSGVGVDITLRDFLLASSAEGMTPVMATIEPVSNSFKQSQKDTEQTGKVAGGKGKTVRLSGTAIFKDFKLIGRLNDEETRGLLWITGKLQRGIITAYVPAGGGNVSFNIIKAERKIRPEIRGNKVKINLELKGEGVIYENNTNLDASKPKNIKLMEKALNQDLETRIWRVLHKAQKDYEADIFGFGQQIQRMDPNQWKSVKKQWETIFPEAEVSVVTDLTIVRTGMSGPPLHLKEDEVKKK